MKSFFASKEIPFFLTLLFALVGYHFSELTKNILDSPSVEYNEKIVEVKTIKDSVYKQYNYTIFNITNDKSFQNLTINFKSTGSSLKIFGPGMSAIEPASLHFVDPKSLDNRLLIFEIIRFQPGDKYNLTFNSSSHIRDKQLTPYIYLTTDSTLRLIKRSFSTWVVKYYLQINTCLIFFWIILIVFYLLKFKNDEKKAINP